MFEYGKEAIGNDTADDFCTCFFQTGTSPVVWVICQAFAFGAWLIVLHGMRESQCLDCPSRFG